MLNVKSHACINFVEVSNIINYRMLWVKHIIQYSFMTIGVRTQ